MSITDCLIWMLFGVVFIAILYFLYRYLKAKNLTTGKFVALMILGIITDALILFTLAWAYSSILEGEYQAVGMGFLFFGGAALVFAIITFRLATLKPKNEKEEKTALSGETGADA